MKLVWIPDEECWGYVKELSTYHCIVEFTKDGIMFEELFLKEDIVDARELGIDYEIEESTEF